MGGRHQHIIIVRGIIQRMFPGSRLDWVSARFISPQQQDGIPPRIMIRGLCDPSMIPFMAVPGVIAPYLTAADGMAGIRIAGIRIQSIDAIIFRNRSWSIRRPRLWWNLRRFAWCLRRL